MICRGPTKQRTLAATPGQNASSRDVRGTCRGASAGAGDQFDPLRSGPVARLEDRRIRESTRHRFTRRERDAVGRLGSRARDARPWPACRPRSATKPCASGPAVVRAASSTVRQRAYRWPSNSGAMMTDQSAQAARRAISRSSLSSRLGWCGTQPGSATSACVASRIVSTVTPGNAAKSAASAASIARPSAASDSSGGSPLPRQPPATTNS